MTRPIWLLAAAAVACGTPREGAPPAEPAPRVVMVPVPMPLPLPLPVEPPAAPRDLEALDTLTLSPVSFEDLPGWADDRHGEAIPSFLRSCAELAKRRPDEPIGVDGYSGKVRDWRRACAAAAKVRADDHAAARRFFETEFAPYAAHGKDGPEGKMTGYYVQPLRGSRRRHGPYQYPIYARPADLVSIDLVKFIDDPRARRIWGRVDAKTGTVVPYYTREEIRKGALDGKGLELLWVDDRVDVLFTQIEGSGKVKLDDGSEVWLEFAGKNGRAYRGVGKLLREMGELEPGKGTMQDIRAWFDANPHRIDELFDKNASVVFFAISKQPGALGSQGSVILTARRSLAVDRAFVAFSTPIWVDTRAPRPREPGSHPWRGLLIAQDTGGAILGAVRGDVYWGDDEDAADVGGRMGGKGRWWLLLPKGVTPPAGPIAPVRKTP